MHPIKVDLTELTTAFNSSDTLEMTWYLNLETGEIVPISDEIRRTLLDVYKELKQPGPSSTINFAQAIQNFPEQDWVKEALVEADQVEKGLGQKFLTVSHDLPDAAKSDSRDFIASVLDPDVRSELQEAFDGPRPLKRFKEVLNQYPDERERWHKFKSKRLKERVIAWLNEEGLDPID